MSFCPYTASIKLHKKHHSMCNFKAERVIKEKVSCLEAYNGTALVTIHNKFTSTASIIL